MAQECFLVNFLQEVDLLVHGTTIPLHMHAQNLETEVGCAFTRKQKTFYVSEYNKMTTTSFEQLVLYRSLIHVCCIFINAVPFRL